MNREKMIGILLLFFLISTSGVLMFVVAMIPSYYRAEENNNITIRMDGHVNTDMSRTNMFCFLQSTPLKVFYEMIKAVEIPESQHQQFAGRLQCDKDALREGRVRLHLTRVTTEDSGKYRCDLSSYDMILKRWQPMSSEHFILDVSKISKTPVTPKPGPKPGPKATELPSRFPVKVVFQLFLVVIFVVLFCPAWCHFAACLRGEKGHGGLLEPIPAVIRREAGVDPGQVSSPSQG